MARPKIPNEKPITAERQKSIVLTERQDAFVDGIVVIAPLQAEAAVTREVAGSWAHGLPVVMLALLVVTGLLSYRLLRAKEN